MKASVEPLEGNKVKLSVEVDEQEMDVAVAAAFRKIAREVRIPGFRPGKAPRRILEARLGSDYARQEALRAALPEFYARALEETDVDAIAPPDIDITGGEEEGPLAFDAVVEVRPRLRLAGYDSLEITVPKPGATDEEVDAQIDRLRDQFAELSTVSRPARDGDHVLANIKGYRHAEAIEGLTADDYSYEVGSGSVVPELDENLRGAGAGDILKFTATAPDEEEVGFQVLVKEVRQKVLPEVSDEWANEASEFDTVAELRADLATRLGTIKKVQAQLALQQETVNALTELVAEEVPEALVGADMERRLHDLHHRLEAQGATITQYMEATGTSQEELVAALREQAVASVKADLALRAVADAEALDPTDAEVDAEIARLAERTGQKAAAVRRQLERNQQMPAVRSDLRKRKALEWVAERVEVVDEDGQPVDRAELRVESGAESDMTDQHQAEEQFA
jgi:trigger factor